VNFQVILLIHIRVFYCFQTYCVDRQVPDSACTATAYLSGVKTNYEMIGLSASVKLNDCPGSVAPGNQTQSLADWSMAKGKAVGLVTTTRVTHASPAGMYAHAANREWESDAYLAEAANLTDVTQCEDIAKQLITRSPGIDMKASITLLFIFQKNVCMLTHFSI